MTAPLFPGTHGGQKIKRGRRAIHLIADCRYPTDGSPSWSECQCGARIEAVGPEELAVAWGRHVGRVIRPTSYYGGSGQKQDPTPTRDEIDPRDFEWGADPGGGPGDWKGIKGIAKVT